ncbi:uncharacterized protein LOC106777161 isoform X4 [Vigna radiata var. radiata]|uniref:Uncharacterized protein LOC106777161 isoform X4 n=1 Tax=Vigna radiata var. radiata TaxID=3916 RepID=A0A3Q0EKH0_VIGRR|nr:uncharacterized protein LOC106777161 isoform X4 [Vigna radiata var. radiata]
MRYMKPLQLFQHLSNSTRNQRGRLLGLDVGEKYVGLALSDFDNKIASPFSVLVRKKSNICLMASDFQNLMSKYSLKGFVVGLPFDRHRVASEAAPVKILIDHLCRTKMLEGVKYTYWNECFTSKGYLDFVNRKMKQTAVECRHGSQITTTSELKVGWGTV